MKYVLVTYILPVEDETVDAMEWRYRIADGEGDTHDHKFIELEDSDA